MKSNLIFLIEDDEFVGKAISHYISLNPDLELMWFKNGKDTLANLYHEPAIAIVDYSLPDYKADKLITKIKEVNPQISFIAISAQEELQVVVDLLKIGVHDYIIKNKELYNRLWLSLNSLREKVGLREEVAELKQQIAEYSRPESNIIGKSAQWLEIERRIDKVAESQIPVCIKGETGSGKEMVARRIHNLSNRAGEFVVVNLTSIPYELAEDQLFGHEKGAFTGAIQQHIGLFEKANGGTLFMDELHNWDLRLQSKVLRVIQESELIRLGGTKTIKTDFRIISATTENLESLVASGQFREDLYYRILGMSIPIAPLRERVEDISVLAEYFATKYCENQELEPRKIGVRVLKKLMGYDFPGNVRELKSTMEAACATCETSTLSPDDIVFRGVRRVKSDAFDQYQSLKELEVSAIGHFLEVYKGHVGKTAKRLGIGTTKIYDLLRERKSKN